MITVKPTDNLDLINQYGRENTAYLIMREEDKEIGMTAMNTSKKCYEFLGPNLKQDEDILAILNG